MAYAMGAVAASLSPMTRGQNSGSILVVLMGGNGNKVAATSAIKC